MPDGRLQEIASNFSKFSGGGPRPARQRLRLRRSVRGFAPLPAPLSKIPGSASEKDSNIGLQEAIARSGRIVGNGLFSSSPIVNSQMEIQMVNDGRERL